MAEVLVVSYDPNLGKEVTDEIAGRGFDLMWCPGPRDPSYVCIAGRGETCPIARKADVVVLDGWLATDEARKGMPFWHLLLYYRNLGLPVVLLQGSHAPPHPIDDDGVTVVPRESDPSKVVDAIEEFLLVSAAKTA